MGISAILKPIGLINERRREKRYQQRRRCLTVTVNGYTIPIVVRNISTWGGACQGLLGVEVGAQIELNFEDNCSVRGRVQWVQDDLCGIRFLTPISAAKLFFNQRSQAERARRVPVSRQAVVFLESTARRAIIRNVSESGMMLETFCQLRTGDTIDVVAGKFQCKGLVRWSNGKNAGIELLAPLQLDEFERLSLFSPLDLVSSHKHLTAEQDGGSHA